MDALVQNARLPFAFLLLVFVLNISVKREKKEGKKALQLPRLLSASKTPVQLKC